MSASPVPPGAPLEALDLDAIEARANAASAGPWRCWNGWGPVKGTDLMAMAHLGPEGISGGLLGALDGRSSDLYATRADAEFVAHARTDVPALCAEVRRLRTAELTARLTATVLDELTRVACAIAKHQASGDRIHPLTCGNDSMHRVLVPAFIGRRLRLGCLDCDWVQEIPRYFARFPEALDCLVVESDEWVSAAALAPTGEPGNG